MHTSHTCLFRCYSRKKWQLIELVGVHPHLLLLLYLCWNWWYLPPAMQKVCILCVSCLLFCVERNEVCLRLGHSLWLRPKTRWHTHTASSLARLTSPQLSIISYFPIVFPYFVDIFPYVATASSLARLTCPQLSNLTPRIRDSCSC